MSTDDPGRMAYEALKAQLAEWGGDGDGDGDGIEDDDGGYGDEGGEGVDVSMAEAAEEGGTGTTSAAFFGAGGRSTSTTTPDRGTTFAAGTATASPAAPTPSTWDGDVFGGPFGGAMGRRRPPADHGGGGGHEDGVGVGVGGEGGGGEHMVPFFPPPKSSRAASTSDGGSREFRSNAAYHDAMRTYLVRRSAVLGRIDLLNASKEEEEEGGMAVVAVDEDEDDARKQRSELLEEYRTAQVDLLRSFFDAAALDREEESSSSDVKRGGGGRAIDDSWSDAEREANVWDLLRRLLSHGTDRRTGEASLLYDPPTSSSSGSSSAAASSALEWDPDDVDVDSYPAELVRRAKSVQPSWDGEENLVDGNDPCETPEFVLQRRGVIVKWLESCFARHYGIGPDDAGDGGGGGGSIGAWIVPPRERNVMWPKTISKARARGKAVELDPDAPLRASSSSTKTTADPRLLDPRDEEDDAELLRAVLLSFMCGNPQMAGEICVSAGQSWRAASMRGGEPYGIVVPSSEDEGEDGADGGGGGGVIRRTGNPRRAAWKIQCRLLGRRLAEEYATMAVDGTRREAGRPYHPSVYESAVYAVLSDDVRTAMDNPALFPAAGGGGGGSTSSSSPSSPSPSSSSSWEVTMWIHLRASVERSVDDLLSLQATKRRQIGRKLPYPGCSSPWDDDCIVSPGEAEEPSVPVDEGSIVDAAAHRAGMTTTASSSSSSVDPYRLAASCFVEGTVPVREYVFSYVRGRCRRIRDDTEGNGGGVAHEGGGGDGEFLRFASHLILFLVLTYPDEMGMVVAGDHDDAGMDGGDATSVMVDVVRAYMDRDLVGRRHLPLVSLYASLLPRDDLVDAYVDFLVDVEDDDERRLVLDMAREDFVEGLDLVILRRVVERILDGDDEGGDGRRGGGLVRVGTRDVGVGGDGSGGTAVDVEVGPSDLRKLTSIRWMCYHPEHRLDALVYANALLRGLLLAGTAPMSSASRGGSTVAVAAPPPGAGSKLTAGKLLVARFVPPDTVDVVRDFVASSSSSDGTPMTEWADDAIAEHVAMCMYLDAHTAHEEWRNTMATCEQNMPPPASRAPPAVDVGGPGGAEADIARRREVRDRRRLLRSLGRAALRATVTAEEKLSAVLRHDRPGGWLGVGKGGGSPHPHAGDDEASSWDGHKRRGDEMVALRSSCLPHSVFMLHAVLDGMASWVAGIGNEGRGDDDGDDSGLFGEEVSAGVSESMFEPVHWHRKALAMADLVASDEYGLHDVMNGDEIGSFLGRMAESGVKLLRCSGGGDDGVASSSILAS